MTPEIIEFKHEYNVTNDKHLLFFRLEDGRVLIPVLKAQWRNNCPKCQGPVTRINPTLKALTFRATTTLETQNRLSPAEVFNVRYCENCRYYMLAALETQYWATEELEFTSNATDRTIRAWFSVLQSHKLGTPAWLAKYLKVNLCQQ